MCRWCVRPCGTPLPWHTQRHARLTEWLQLEGPTPPAPPVVGAMQGPPEAPVWRAVEATFQRQQLRMLAVEVHGTCAWGAPGRAFA
jgi:hypothetical protein